MITGDKPFIIGEISGNHGGDLVKACTLIGVAAEVGCDAAKFQLYRPEDMDDPDNNEIYEKYQVPVDWLPHLFRTGAKYKIPVFASVFAPWAVEELEKHNCPAYKLASPESTRLPTLRYLELVLAIRKTGKPLIASSGSKDIAFVRALEPDYLLYCVAGYPAKIEPAHLLALAHTDGLSDHSSDVLTPAAALHGGARIIEKHFKLDDDCIDAAFSLNPTQMKLLCDLAHQ